MLYPVIGTTNGFKELSLVTSINSPIPSAACSLVSAEPLMRLCIIKQIYTLVNRKDPDETVTPQMH